MYHTEKSWYKTEAVGKHGSLDDVEVWQNDEDENCDSHGMQCLAEEHSEEFLGVGFGAGFEEADPHGTYECPQLWHQVCYQQAPHPSDSLHLRQLCDKLLLPTCRNIQEFCDSIWDSFISLTAQLYVLLVLISNETESEGAV